MEQNEKDWAQVEHASTTDEKVASTAQTLDPDAGLTPEEKIAKDRALLRKIDLNLLPWLCLLYLVSFLDRSNIGNAKIAGLDKDLNLTDAEWQASLAIFFVSYSIFEPASNMLLKKLRPSIYIPTIVVLWGIITTLQGVVTNFAGLAACRWFLGMVEAGLFPGCQFYLSCWYRRTEFGVRSALFFASAALAGAFGGLLAAAITGMEGIGGKPGWAWIFIIEGIATVLIGVVSFWMVYDFPDESVKFLSVEERVRVYHRLKADQQASAEHEAFKWTYLWASFRDWKTYTASLIYMGCGGGLYAFSLFLPTILVGMGYKGTTAQLMSVPPYAAAAIITVLIGYVADRMRKRGIFAILVSPLAVVGFAILLTDAPPGAKYAATFLAAIGIYPCIPNTIIWVASNTEGVYKRGITLGLAMGWANLQGCVVSNVYRRVDAPRFILGHAVVMAYLALALWAGSVLHYVLLRRENRLRRDGKRDSWVLGQSPSEIALLGDKRPDFLYTL